MVKKHLGAGKITALILAFLLGFMSVMPEIPASAASIREEDGAETDSASEETEQEVLLEAASETDASENSAEVCSEEETELPLSDPETGNVSLEAEEDTEALESVLPDEAYEQNAVSEENEETEPAALEDTEDSEYTNEDIEYIRNFSDPAFIPEVKDAAIADALEYKLTRLEAALWQDADGNGKTDLSDAYALSKSVTDIITETVFRPVYDPGKASLYDVVRLDPGSAEFALVLNSNEAIPIVSGFFYDAATGLLYLEKALVEGYRDLGIMMGLRAQNVLVKAPAKRLLKASGGNSEITEICQKIREVAPFTLVFEKKTDLPAPGAVVSDFSGNDMKADGFVGGNAVFPSAEASAWFGKYVGATSSTYNFGADMTGNQEDLTVRLEIAIGEAQLSGSNFSKAEALIKSINASDLKTSDRNGVIYLIRQKGSGVFTIGGKKAALENASGTWTDEDKAVLVVSCSHVSIPVKQEIYNATLLPAYGIIFSTVVFAVDEPDENGVGFLYLATGSAGNFADSGGGKSQDLFGLTKVRYRVKPEEPVVPNMDPIGILLKKLDKETGTEGGRVAV